MASRAARLRSIALAVVVALVVGACADATSSSPSGPSVSVASAVPTAAPTSSTSSTSTTSSATTTTTAAPTTTLPPEPVWADEFDGAVGALPDPAKWRFEIGGNGWGNRQLEHTSDRAARLDGGGHLVITSQPAPPDLGATCWYGPCRYESARLSTEGLFAQEHGRVEVRLGLPGGEATWPAVWMLGANRAEVGWPNCGEIDIVEHIGRRGGEVQGVAHAPGYSGEAGIIGRTQLLDVAAFHVFAIEWDHDAVVWSVDGRVFHRIDRDRVASWPFDQPFFLIMNVAVGGTLGGDPGPADAQPQHLVVDYVRVYR